MAAGVLAVFLSPAPVASLAGFAMLGVGTSAIFPLAMSAAAQRTDRPAAINVAALAQISFVIFFAGPPLLGFVAEHFGIRVSYLVVLPVIVAGLLLTGHLQPKRKMEAIAADA
jgi:cyanate permease